MANEAPVPTLEGRTIEEWRNLAERYREELRRFRAVDRIARILASGLAPEALFTSLLRELRLATGCERCLIASLDERERRYSFWKVDSDVAVPPHTDEEREDAASWFFSEVYGPKRPKIVPDTRAIPRPVMRRLSNAGFRSLMSVPVLEENRVVAHINCASRSPGHFTEAHEALLMAVTEYFAQALKVGRDYERARRHEARFSALVGIVGRLIQSLDIEALLGSVAEEAARLFGGEANFSLLREGQLVRAGSTAAARDMIARDDIRLGESISGLVARTQAPIVTHDLAADRRANHRDRRVKDESRTGALMCVPLLSDAECVGTLHVYREKGYRFTGEDQELAMLLGRQVGQLIQNAEQHRALEETMQRLQETQEMLIRMEKMSSIGTLTAGAAHEILNPANIIGLHAQRLRWESEEGSPQRETAEVILRSVERIAKICEDLRRFSRDEKPELASFDLAGAVAESLRPLERELPLLNIETEILLPPEGAAAVLGDRSQIQQVLLNLYNNARDAMPEGGKLTVRLDRADDEEGQWWEIRVTDTGAGIPEDVLPKIFDPFFTTKPQDKGTGLGLSVSYGIIESHGGKLWAESAPGRGATFICRLPVSSEGDSNGADTRGG